LEHKNRSEDFRIVIAEWFLQELPFTFVREGRLIENLVFLELCRRSDFFTQFGVNYWKEYEKAEGREVDFVITDRNEISELINVSYASSREDIPVRELKGLLKASEELKCTKLRIFTWEYYENEDIEFTPLWYWLLESGIFSKK